MPANEARASLGKHIHQTLAIAWPGKCTRKHGRAREVRRTDAESDCGERTEIGFNWNYAGGRPLI